jgi:cadmium resistance protein CadD (predicted permease)
VVGVAQVSQATGMFAVTNIDDLVLLALFFAQARGRRAAVWRVVTGQYLAFAGILVASVVGVLGAGLLPDRVVPYLGLVPLALGIRAAWRARRGRDDAADADADADDDAVPDVAGGPRATTVAAVTFANGGDNIGVYVPVLATAGAGGTAVYVVVFLVLTGVWCVAGRTLAGRRPVAQALARKGHLILPLVLIAIGVVILVGGGAFGL